MGSSDLNAMETASPAAPYRDSVDSLLAALGADAQRGLAAAEAQARLARHGRNELLAAPRPP
ncbi:MAG TPA: cation-transporting P-type ATPase, partial [Vicinamibacteria bacterium]|nr:cation-transporting P-type ATPase [Vicinamibacteria bacterium]